MREKWLEADADGQVGLKEPYPVSATVVLSRLGLTLPRSGEVLNSGAVPLVFTLASVILESRFIRTTLADGEYRNRHASARKELEDFFMLRKKIVERERIDQLLIGREEPIHGQMQTFITDVMIAYRTAYPNDLVPSMEIFHDVIERHFHPEKVVESTLTALEELMQKKVEPMRDQLLSQRQLLSSEQFDRLAGLFPHLKA